MSAGVLEKGEETGLKQTGSVIRQDLKQSPWIVFLGSVESCFGKEDTELASGVGGLNGFMTPKPTTAAAGETSLGLLSTSHQRFSDTWMVRLKQTSERLLGL